MKLLACDRCSNQENRGDAHCTIIIPQKLKVFWWPRHTIEKEYDLCTECEKSFDEWIRNSPKKAVKDA